jgi:polysaccharide pyruvyl transferase WcaK-like protein
MVVGPSGHTIALLGHYGGINLGDEAIIQALQQCIERRIPSAKVVGISANPLDTEKRHGMPAFPVNLCFEPAPNSGTQATVDQTDATSAASVEKGDSGLRQLLKSIPLVYPLIRGARDLAYLVCSTLPKEMAFNLRCIRFLRSVDMVLISGSGQLIDDWYGAWGFPYTLARWAVLSKLTGTKFAAVSVGAGPIDGWLSKRMYRLCLSLCDFRSFRDERSRTVIREIGFRKECYVFPDLAHSLGDQGAQPARDPTHQARPLVGINPMPILDSRFWHTDEPEKTKRYRSAMASLCATLMREGYPFFFYRTHPTDQFVIDDIIAELAQYEDLDVSGDDLVRSDTTVDDVLASIRSADFVVATRFHGVLLPLAQSVPAVGISFHHKTKELMDQMGQGNYTVDFHTITIEELLGAFRRLEANFAKERVQLREIGARQRKALDDQCDQLARLLASAPQGENIRRDHDGTP